jgi:hypothetical protein
MALLLALLNAHTFMTSNGTTLVCHQGPLRPSHLDVLLVKSGEGIYGKFLLERLVVDTLVFEVAPGIQFPRLRLVCE